MGLSFKGYILEKPRVGSANSAFTASPDNLVSNSGAYSSVFGDDESDPGRCDYLVLTKVDGDLPDAEFAWTKNESGVQRFDYDGLADSFSPLPGAPRSLIGILSSDANTNRLHVSTPTALASVSPYRVSLGVIGTGTTINVVTVVNDAAFTAPASGTVQLSLDTGNLHWDPTDISVTYVGQEVYFQQQNFFSRKESTGRLGIAGEVVALNPIPGTGQVPLVRLGYGLHLTAVEKATEGSFSTNPTRGTFQWALSTGAVKFNTADLAANVGEPVYYDGVVFKTGLTLPRQNLSTVSAPTTISALPTSGGDLVFRAVKSGSPSGTATFLTTSTLQDLSASFTTDNVKVGDIAVLTSSTYTGSRRRITSVTPTQLTVAPPFPSLSGANYKIEKKADIHQFYGSSRVDTLASPGKTGLVQVDGTGQVQFSDSDVLVYGSYLAEMVSGDLPIERGLSMRLFRSQVNLDGVDSSLKDVSTFVEVVDSTLADPVIGAPSIFLPVLPIDDEAYPISLSVTQGTGSFTGQLPRLDVPNPPSGLGYTLDFDGRQASYAIRRNDKLIDINERTAAVVLPDPLVGSSNTLFEVSQGLGFSPLTLGVDALLDATPGVLSLIDTLGVVRAEGSSGQNLSVDTLTDPSANFIASGVSAQDLLVVPTGPLQGVYTVAAVATTQLDVEPNFPSLASNVQYQVRSGKEILADRFFKELLLVDPLTKVERVRGLGTLTNSPRLTVALDAIGVTKVRLPAGGVVLPVSVAADLDFIDPGSLPSGSVQVSLSTGNLNFSLVDVTQGGTVSEVRSLTFGVDYRMTPELGFIQLAERLLGLDELWVTYASTSDPTVYNLERGTFLVRKEVVTHALPTSSIPFNVVGREVASNPAASVFRGGRPQTSSQVSVSPSLSTITFLPDVVPTPGGALKVSDALPHGQTVQPSERVYIDYYIYGALGGENTITVLNPPISLAQVSITEGSLTLVVQGDWSATILSSHLLRVETDQVYYVVSSVFDGTATTVTVNQPFRDSATGPKLYLSSGPIPLAKVGTTPAYFVLETAAFDVIPRGMNKVKVVGDRSHLYPPGTVLYFSQGPTTEFYIVTAARYDSTSGKTEITLSQPSARQYASTSYALRRSVRPVYETSTTTVRTSDTPIMPPPAQTLSDAILLYRQVEGYPGVILGALDFKIDNTGKIDLSTPLVDKEEVSILYTRYRYVNPGQLRASYTATIAPTADNGLLGQKLLASLTTYLPDSFYFRIETMTTFRGEVAEQYKNDATSSSPSGGPRTSNASQPKLQDQGSASVYFNEGDLANEDIIARGTLKYYNDAVNHLEDLLRNMDGRVVGDADGKFVFDGTTGATVASLLDANNQIDDRVKISDFPIDTTPPLFPLKYKGTYLRAYEASSTSRFYPTFRNKFGYTVSGSNTNAKTGDAILDFETKNLTGSHPTASRRTPRAVVTSTALGGDTILYVNTTDQVDEAPFSPAFANGMKVVVQEPSGPLLVTQGSPLTVSGKTGTSLSFSGGLPVSIPIGASVYLADSDTSYRKSYRIGFDVTLDLEKGYLLYVKPYAPFDGSVPLVPAELRVQTPNSNELLEAGLFLNNSLTAPFRFPALDGLPLDDDSDQRLPLINPSPVRELGSPGYLATELAYLGAGGILATSTVTPFIGSGSISGGVTLTLTSGTFPAPAPQTGDLVRTLTGLNGLSTFRRIISVTSNSVTVDVAFTVASDPSVTFLVTVAANLTSGGFQTISGAVCTDPTANFTLSGVKRGHTVVLTQVGSALYQRRQVLSVDSATQITLTSPFVGYTTPTLLSPASYRIHNPLSTFSDTQDMVAAPSSLVDILVSNSDSEVEAIDGFLGVVLTDKLSPASSTGTMNGTSLTGTGVDFVSSGVMPGDFVYVTPGQSNQGFYLVEDVTGPTTLTTSVAFPVSGTQDYRIVNAFEVSGKSLVDVFDVRSNAVTFAQSCTSWDTLVSTLAPVEVPPGVVDPSYYAVNYTQSDIANREAQVTARVSYVTSALPNVEAVLASSDRLYDKRYVWIDTRINLEKGVLVKQQRAAANRVKAQEQTLKDLTKLLAVE
jgi:hypothetical protein